MAELTSFRTLATALSVIVAGRNIAACGQRMTRMQKTPKRKKVARQMAGGGGAWQAVPSTVAHNRAYLQHDEALQYCTGVGHNEVE